jgi:AraC family transcriptional regulator of adaptative response/methylated-DNA-[protein]-cysteine methyltransferase
MTRTQTRHLSAKREAPLPSRPDRRDERRWRGVVERDVRAENDFVYAVRTTGIYCRSSCAAKTPRRENVTFFEDAAEAKAAGYRACKRCHPDDAAPSARASALMEQACRAIEACDGIPALAALARQAGLSAHHFHRLFKAATGVTPRGYWIAHRAAHFRNRLAHAASVTAAIRDAGFTSARQFYDISKEVLGMTPTRFKAGAEAIEIGFVTGQCSLGHILAAGTDKGLCAVLLGDDPAALVADLHSRFPKASVRPADTSSAKKLARVIAQIDQTPGAAGLPLDIQGTAFQRRVWDALRAIPPGTTQSYTQIAAAIGAPGSVRAVAGACAANPIAILVPCHRVVRSDGALSGYRWGIERKRALLEREHADTSARQSSGKRQKRG